jgi:ubiquinone/menaquinone biosynthesis C-methylase UbiE
VKSLQFRGDPNIWGVAISFLKEKLDLDNSMALDIGFGTGGFSLALARQSALISNFDISLNAIRNFWNRMHENAISNVSTIHASAVSLPYRDNSYDLVIMNGVLEYTAIGSKGDPRETHIAILKDIKRILKSRGLFYLGMENRYYLKYLVGYKAHDELRFATILPRSLADAFSKIVKKKGYRRYIYSLKGYRELLSDAGFKDIQMHTALPNYKFPEYIIEIEKGDEIKNKIRKTKARSFFRKMGYILAHYNYLYKLIGPDFVILSRA